MVKLMAKTFVALLRGINVGGKHSVPMKMLAEIFAGAGCEHVQTFIQSGNVVFTATAAVAAKVPHVIGEQIRKRLGHEAPVVVRSAEQFEQVVANNPFSKRQDFENFSHVLFCADKLAASAVKQLDPKRSPSDEFECCGQEIYVWLPNGAGKTKLTNAYFDRVLATICTQRNWRTVMKLNEMMNGG
jgi:uncharacterized protein (DUF1697 family)